MKKIIALFLLCCTIILISGCADDRNAIYDDSVKIAKSSDSHLSVMSVYNRNDNEFNMSAQSFTGAKTIWNYDAKNEGDVTFSYSLSVSEGGKAKLVLITPDNEVVTLIENIDNIEEIQSQTVSLKKGKNRIKIVGYDDPKLNLVLSVDVGELVSN